jgi:hypothetical protein
MAATFRSRAPNAKQPLTAYDAITIPQPDYPNFPIALQHDDSGYGATGYESQVRRHSDAHHHVGLDPHASTIQHHALVTTGLQTRSPSAGSYHISDAIPQLQPTESSEQFDMLPPESSTHASWQALHDYAQSHASEHGYALSINTTAKNRSRIKLACVCYGQPKNTHKLTAETRVRKNRVSYKTGCKMWIEGKKQEDGTWLLRVGEPQHNHAGRPSEGWAVQRKRTWGVVGGRIGFGGVTAKEELAKMSSEQADEDDDHEGEEGHVASQTPSHSLERGGLVWKIVEQEMLRKGEPSQGRDRGVGRTVDVLQARLPGIHIFKRDVYNIRAQIKRARKAAGQQVGDGVNSEDEDAEADPDVHEEGAEEEDDESTKETTAQVPTLPLSSNQERAAPMAVHTRGFALDPSLPQRHKTLTNATPSHQVLSASNAELEQLRKENAQLKGMLIEKTKEIKEKNIVIAGLRSQIEYMTSMTMLPS